MPFGYGDVGQIRRGTKEGTWRKETDPFTLEAQCSVTCLIDVTASENSCL